MPYYEKNIRRDLYEQNNHRINGEGNYIFDRGVINV